MYEVTEKMNSLSTSDQLKHLLGYLQTEYKIPFVSVYIIDNTNRVLYAGNDNLPENILNGIDLTLPRVTTGENHNFLSDSKKRAIRERFTIPLNINTAQFLIILESKKPDVLKGKEKYIYKDVFIFKNAVTTNVSIMDTTGRP